jgi:signal transduction histidine kinase
MPQTDDVGRVVGMLGVLQESSVRKQMEQDLRSQALELQEADQRKDEFLAVLAHELRNPLAPIGLAAQLLKRAPDAATHRTADLIRSQVNQMSRLLDDLPDTSRIKSGRLNMKNEWVQARAVVELALQNAGPLLRSRKHRTTVKVDERLALEADPVRLAQVLGQPADQCGQVHTGGRTDRDHRHWRRWLVRLRGQRQRHGPEAGLAGADLRDVLAGRHGAAPA